jgi:outer membrane protein assembly factor BamB/orotate phosphoribosyltransferase
MDIHHKKVLRLAVKKAFVSQTDSGTKKLVYGSKEDGKNVDWIFDFRAVFCDPVFLDAYTSAFVERYKDIYPFQVCGLETAALPLVGAISQKMFSLGRPINTFYIRKSRKKIGLLNMIEGKVEDTPIIIVDDLINSGSSILKQKSALGDVQKKPEHAFAVLAFRDEDWCSRFEKKNEIKLTTLFTLSEVKEELGIKESYPRKYTPLNPFKIEWMLDSPNKNYFYVVPKSAPVLYEGLLYYGRTDGVFVCVNSEGEIVWERKVPFGVAGKFIFSTPAIFKNKVFFGAYDGNFYCLDRINGKVLWVNFDCDWVGSSPAISAKHSIIYVGAEYGFWWRKGGVIALDIDTGEQKWAFRDMPQYTHGSPLVIDIYGRLVCGSNDGEIYILNTKNGKLLSKTKVKGEVKHRPAFDQKSGVICVADHGAAITGLSTKGEILWQTMMIFGSYATPLLYKDRFYVTSFDKCVYCVKARTGELVWKKDLSARIFSSAAEVEGIIVVGANDGKVHGLDPDTGFSIFIQLVGERVTNKVAYEKESRSLYVLDYVSKLYKIKITDRLFED